MNCDAKRHGILPKRKCWLRGIEAMGCDLGHTQTCNKYDQKSALQQSLLNDSSNKLCLFLKIFVRISFRDCFKQSRNPPRYVYYPIF